MNWRKARLSTRRSLSLADEQEYRGNDAASRWLERQEQRQVAERQWKSKRRKQRATDPTQPKTEAAE